MLDSQYPSISFRVSNQQQLVAVVLLGQVSKMDKACIHVIISSLASGSMFAFIFPHGETKSSQFRCHAGQQHVSPARQLCPLRLARSILRPFLACITR